MTRYFAGILLFLCTLSSCGDSRNEGPRLDDQFRPFPLLSQYGLFDGPLVDLSPAPGLIPYDLNTPLFSDYAEKSRFIFIPEGQSAQFVANGPFEFPIGTIIVKTFYYPADFRNPQAERKILETRLLIHTPKGWDAHPYIWNEEQTDAKLEVVGGFKQIDWIDSEGMVQNLNYSIPNKNQCKGCHEWKGKMLPIGPQAKHINKDFEYTDGPTNQLVKWLELGMLNDLPPLEQVAKAAVWNNQSSGSLELRARAYLDINCGHCHNPLGPAKNSGLGLLMEEENPRAWGVYKPPIAAGKGSGNLKFSIVPGHADASILLYRMLSTEPGSMMPELGRKIVHKEGVALIREWIDSLQEPSGEPLN